MDKSPEVTTGDVYVIQWPHPDIVVFENTAYQALVRTFLCFSILKWSVFKLNMIK